MHRLWQERLVATSAAVVCMSTAVWGQGAGAVGGTVTLVENGGAVHGESYWSSGPGWWH